MRSKLYKYKHWYWFPYKSTFEWNIFHNFPSSEKIFQIGEPFLFSNDVHEQFQVEWYRQKGIVWNTNLSITYKIYYKMYIVFAKMWQQLNPMYLFIIYVPQNGMQHIYQIGKTQEKVYRKKYIFFKYTWLCKYI